MTKEFIIITNATRFKPLVSTYHGHITTNEVFEYDYRKGEFGLLDSRIAKAFKSNEFLQKGIKCSNYANIHGLALYSIPEENEVPIMFYENNGMDGYWKREGFFVGNFKENEFIKIKEKSLTSLINMYLGLEGFWEHKYSKEIFKEKIEQQYKKLSTFFSAGNDLNKDVFYEGVTSNWKDADSERQNNLELQLELDKWNRLQAESWARARDIIVG